VVLLLGRPAPRSGLPPTASLLASRDQLDARNDSVALDGLDERMAGNDLAAAAEPMSALSHPQTPGALP
jgi:hypothetical protein